ncbi:hypothetical protein [Caldifermentibacillus hisashii]|nr:hypothetical protein [Caldifermentibacillus hisashii]
MIEKVLLGEVDWFGIKAKAYREVYTNQWKFVIETDNEKVYLLSY